MTPLWPSGSGTATSTRRTRAKGSPMPPPWLAALVSRSAPLIASPAPRSDRARAVEHLRSCGASWGDLARATGLHPSSVRSLVRPARPPRRTKRAARNVDTSSRARTIAIAAREARELVRARVAEARARTTTTNG